MDSKTLKASRTSMKYDQIIVGEMLILYVYTV